MLRWKLRPSRLSVMSAVVLTMGISVVVGGFGTQAADVPAEQPTAQSAASDKKAALPTVEEIQAAYLANSARLMPMGVTYRVLIKEEAVAIESARRRLKETETILRAKRSDISKFNGQKYDEAQWAWIVRSTKEERESLKLVLEPEVVERRLKGWVAERGYVWTDGKSFHIRKAKDAKDEDVNLFPGSVSPAENLTKLYGSIRMASWSSANAPPLRCWSGNQGRVSKTLNDCVSGTFLPPLGFVRLDWTHTRDWHALDHFMSQEARRYSVVGRAELNGRSTIVVDGLFTDPEQNGWRERVRAWIDPTQGYLPLRLEWRFVDSSGKAAPNLKRHVEVSNVKKVAGGYYPLQITRQEYTYDHKANEEQRREKAAGRVPEAAPAPPSVPRRTKTWEVSEIAPHKVIEPAALALEFPKGALFTNAVDKRMYHVGDAQPLPEPVPPVQPGQIAPPVEAASWADGGSRKLADFRGKVVVLRFARPLDKLEDCDGFSLMTKGIGAKDAVLLDLYPAGTEINQVRAFQRTHKLRTLAGVDKGANADRGVTAHRYPAGSGGGIVVVGRDGRVAFNFGVLEEGDAMVLFQRAAEALSIPWPLDENGPMEQVERQHYQILEFVIGEQIERALAER